MPTTTQLEVTKLSLDLKNFRTVPQKKEQDAIKAMISIKPERFFAVLESIIEDGYLLTENIIVLTEGAKNVVKEGNRRIAALKLIHGQYKPVDFNIPSSAVEKITKLDANWKKENSTVPCTIFTAAEIDLVDKVVALAHGKGEKASRDPWNSVARARHNRDVKNISEPALDLLEQYLQKGNNINNQQKERWGGEYPFTVLDEALRKIYARLGFSNSAELAKKYPQISKASELEDILLNIGLEQIKFETIRNTQNDFATSYGIPPLAPAVAPANPTSSNPTTPGTGKNAGPMNTNTPPAGTNTSTPANSSGSANANTPQPIPVPQPPKAVAVNDPKHIAALLKKFSPRGNNRQKVVTLRDEIKKLKIKNNPVAFCFLLRSMFEISAKAYCSDHGIAVTKSGGEDRKLVEILKDVTNHLTGTGSNLNKAVAKILHGAMAEIAKPEGMLSVTSMNQLVHNPAFSVSPPDICTLFGNIYPLLEAMN